MKIFGSVISQDFPAADGVVRDDEVKLIEADFVFFAGSKRKKDDKKTAIFAI